MLNGDTKRWPQFVELNYPYHFVRGLYYARQATMGTVYAVEGGYMAQDQTLEDSVALVAELALWARAHAKAMYEKRKSKRGK